MPQSQQNFYFVDFYISAFYRVSTSSPGIIRLTVQIENSYRCDRKTVFHDVTNRFTGLT